MSITNHRKLSELILCSNEKFIFWLLQKCLPQWLEFTPLSPNYCAGETLSCPQDSLCAAVAMNGSGGKEQVEEERVCEEGPGICAHLLTIGALFMIVTTLPLSLLFVIKVVQVGF